MGEIWPCMARDVDEICCGDHFANIVKHYVVHLTPICQLCLNKKIIHKTTLSVITSVQLGEEI